MKSHFSRSTLFRLLALGLGLGFAGSLAAQTTQRRTTTTPTRPTTSQAARPTTAQGGGGGSSAGANRQYVNSTMVGDALITSDLETRRLIIVTDDDTNENIRTIIASLDQPKPQVLINVVFVQVTHDNGLDLGTEGTFKLDTTPSSSGLTKFGIADAFTDATQYGAFYKVLNQDINVTLRALATVSKTEILSRPSILTRNNQQATIMVGQQVPFITNSRVSEETGATTNTVTYQDIGIILRVTPFITAEGLVEMIVSPEISSLSATTVPISNTVNSPVIDKRSADTVVVTPSGSTVVIGGLIATQTKDKDDKVPILGDIPVIGYAFKRKQKSEVKTELLIFLTPRVVANPTDMANVTKDEKQNLDMVPKAFPEDMERYMSKE
jgi:general secretion pathway protein D